MPVTVEPHNPNWATQFTQIKSQLQTFLAHTPYQSIQHVGSTSIPNLPAKPILDIDVVATPSQLPGVISALSKPETGYLYMGELSIKDRHAFRAPGMEPVRNLYVCVEGSAALRNHLGVRELLLRDEVVREEYGRLKMELGSRGLEIHEYMNLKGKCVTHLLELSGALTKEEIDEIKVATGSAKRTYPIKTANLVLREFIITDVQGLIEVGYSTKRAQDLAIEIIQDAGRSDRTRMELAVLLQKNAASGAKMIGRIVMRRMKRTTETVDCAVRGRLASWVEVNDERAVVYVEVPDEYVEEAMDAFLPVAGKIMGYELTGFQDIAGVTPEKPSVGETRWEKDSSIVDSNTLPPKSGRLKKVDEGRHFYLLVENDG